MQMPETRFGMNDFVCEVGSKKADLSFRNKRTPATEPKINDIKMSADRPAIRQINVEIKFVDIR